jgi:hypothetical protein
MGPDPGQLLKMTPRLAQPAPVDQDERRAKPQLDALRVVREQFAIDTHGRVQPSGVPQRVRVAASNVRIARRDLARALKLLERLRVKTGFEGLDAPGDRRGRPARRSSALRALLDAQRNPLSARRAAQHGLRLARNHVPALTGHPDPEKDGVPPDRTTYPGLPEAQAYRRAGRPDKARFGTSSPLRPA